MHPSVGETENDRMEEQAPEERSQGRHPIGVVAERTGLTPERIRAWENRYQVVEPFRSSTGHRLYSDDQVDRLKLLRQLILGRRSIGQVAHLSTRELEELVAKDEVARLEAPGPPAEEPESVPSGFVDEAMETIQRLDPVSLDAVLRRAVMALGVAPFLREVAVPLLGTVGNLWHSGELRIAQEHLASTGMRRVLDWLRWTGRGPEAGPILLLATPVGERHEMGALLAGAAAVSEGWEVIYLGPEVPTDDIAFAAIRTGARAVGLSAMYAPEPETLTAEILDLRGRLPPRTLLLLGGPAAMDCREGLEESHVLFLEDVSHLGRLLKSESTG